MDKNASLMQRREASVANGVGVFGHGTAVAASNATITDENGKKYIDFAGGIGVTNAGHCPPPVVEAIKQQAEAYIHTSFNVATYEPYIALCEKLNGLFPHGNKTKSFLASTGAEAVENAVKIARQATGRSSVICFSEAFHGRTLMALTLTSKTAYKTNCGPFAPEVYRLPYPNFFNYGDVLTQEEFIDREIKRLYDFGNTYVPTNQIAAIIIELVQGEGGFHVAPKRYVRALREFCDEHGIMLIFDEVQSGFGRTGKWAAYEHYDITPDLSTWAKSLGSGMPISAVIGRAEIMDAAGPSTIGGTYIGNPVCCAAALATINYMEEIDICKLGEDVGRITMEFFNQLSDEFDVIGEARGLGAMCAIEFVKDNDPNQPNGELCAKVLSTCYDRGLIVISAGVHKNVLRVLSPLTISEEELRKGFDILKTAIADNTGQK